MKITFWGVRGSIPAPLGESELRDKIHRLLSLAVPSDNLSTIEGREDVINRFQKTEPLVIGGNTTCIELQSEGETLIFDMGTGIRQLGSHIMRKTNGIKIIHIFLSHTHWDHIYGFPFFRPAYFPKYKLNFYSVHPELKERLEIQQDLRFFPVKLEQMASSKEFIQLKENNEITIGKLTVKNHLLYHPGSSYGYSVTANGKKFVFATDSEYIDNSRQLIDGYLEFFMNADLLVFDSQYSFTESLHKANWGHSSAVMGINLAIDAHVKKLVLFHHGPENMDKKIIRMLKQADQYKKMNYPNKDLEIILAQEGLTIDI